jgi:hypothetical protein
MESAVATVRQLGGPLSTTDQLQLIAADQNEVSNLRHEIVWQECERPEFAKNCA